MLGTPESRRSPDPDPEETRFLAKFDMKAIFGPGTRHAANTPPHDFSNPIWEFYTLDGGKAICQVCDKRITYRNNSYVTNLVTHLRTRGIGHENNFMSYMSKKEKYSNKHRDDPLHFTAADVASTILEPSAST